MPRAEYILRLKTSKVLKTLEVLPADKPLRGWYFTLPHYHRFHIQPLRSWHFTTGFIIHIQPLRGWQL